MGGGVKGYSTAYMVIGIIAGIMVLLTLGLKNRQQELSMLEQNGQAVPATD
jgi:hypothetical protein